MIGIVRLALKRPYTFVVMAILIMIFGVTSALRTPTDVFPNINIPVISVVFSYTGLPADDMAGRIVTFYERSLPNSVNDIEHIESQSIVNYGIIKIFFQPTVNINAALAQVNGMSQTVLKQMPAGITPPLIISFNASSVPILQLALSSPAMSDTQIYDSALNFIRPALAPVPGAALPLPFGGKVRQVQADLNQQALHQYGISANDVINALSLQNLITPVGTEKIGTNEYTVNLNGSPATIDAFNNLPVKTVNGTVIYMRDVAFVHDGSPPQINSVHVNGASAVLLTIMKSGTASTLNIINGIKALLPHVSQTLPSSLKLTAVGDQSVFVTDAVSSVVHEGVIAAVLTGMMILLFLGSWRSTLIITLSIPLAILAALTGLSLLGETINVMTLGGLALAVGILVDDATVTIENINWHLEQGKEIEPAIMDGAKQIVVPATVSLLCICIAFVPMFGLSGVAGYLFRPLAEAVILALAASYVLSRTLVPTLANYLLHKHVAHDEGKAPSRNPLVRAQRAFERGFERVRSAYEGLLRACLAHRVAVIAGFLIFSIGSFGLAPFLGQDFFPSVDSGQIKMHIRAPTGMRLEQTTTLTDRISAAIQGKIIPADQIGGIVSNIGLSVSGINMAYNNSGTIGPGDADILISLKPNHGPTDDYIKTMREKLPRQFPGTTFAFLPADMVSQVLNFGVPAPIDIQIAGKDLEANRTYANTLLAKVRGIPGVADARIQQAFQQPTLNVNVDRSMSSLVGLTEKDVATAMLTTLSGSTQSAPTYWLNPANGVNYPVSIQTPQRDIDTMAGLKNLPVSSTASSNAQLLGGLADIQRGRSNAVVTHYNVQPTIDIYATPQGRDLGGVAADIQKVLDATSKDMSKGATASLRGQISTMTSAYSELYIGLAAAIVLIYLLIVVNFQSWIDPFVIVMALPTALAGIVWMLFVSGTTLSVPALTGAIMCMGVATANSILVISFAREKMAEGARAFEAAFQAGTSRFRPVMMTALAMVIGMLPMAIEPGQNMPLGRAVIGGLIFATCATLFLVPTIFDLVHGHHRTSNQSPEAVASPSH